MKLRKKRRQLRNRKKTPRTPMLPPKRKSVPPRSLRSRRMQQRLVRGRSRWRPQVLQFRLFPVHLQHRKLTFTAIQTRIRTSSQSTRMMGRSRSPHLSVRGRRMESPLVRGTSRQLIQVRNTTTLPHSYTVVNAEFGSSQTKKSSPRLKTKTKKRWRSRPPSDRSERQTGMGRREAAIRSKRICV
ncbi:hypothetical protein SAICODRAFT_194350 [Saitoella complicata NRRL Y-17804]|uniref:uncharacterized protein n=1 Tax=Saitoella complicata (strain BCRC 22490 / CBS 7301 / JCM 7358 / NBRC 10748 / NRRL Y-17804) TaxID=698492 RepID=UPI000866DB2B|nr:uncharacterized protein SAICODRAFT_194350 [Saitoella complicata NRRL Y-17804]ODQ49635.1 hypothetical protein SAICODRAFT_194350 [Saitoella complicata NRRL Y-17804]